MIELTLAVAIWVLTPLLVAFMPGRDAFRAGIGAIGIVLGAASLAVAAFPALSGAAITWEAAVAHPFGPLAIHLDPLAAVFLVPIAVIGALASVFALGYARMGHGEANARVALVALPILLASMTVVVVAANMVLLLAAWELMTLSSWQLMTADHRDPAVRGAGLRYLVAGHVSGAALALLFALLAPRTGWQLPIGPVSSSLGGLPAWPALLTLVMLGFGTKAAIVPLHVWLPDAHAAAPSHVSALMSGVLITLGFYGIVRFVPLIGAPSRAVAMTLMALGALGACGGIVMSLSQRDVKRVLAYSTIENAGLVAMEIGAAVLAGAAGRPLVAALAWTAALLHLWNHAVAKGLLFFAAGAIARAVGSRDLERWGGLLRRMPLLSSTVIVGGASLASLPGTYGFAGVWMFLTALFLGGRSLAGADRLAMLFAVIAVAFTEGLALMSYVRVLGVGLLGHPRDPGAARIRPRPEWRLALPTLLLSTACVALVAVLGPLLALLGPAVSVLMPGAPLDRVRRLSAPLPWLAALPLGVVVLGALYRLVLRRTRPVRGAVTWDCGYARPEPTMQYTASSLAQPVTGLLEPTLRTSVRWQPPAGLWPAAMNWESRTPERALAELYRPAFTRLARWLGYFRRLQQGHVMVYLRYLWIALLGLLLWLFWPLGAPR